MVVHTTQTEDDQLRLARELLEISSRLTEKAIELIGVMTDASTHSIEMQATQEPAIRYYREGNNLMRCRGNKKSGCDYNVAIDLIAGMIAKGGMNGSVKVNTIFGARNVPMASRTVVTDWLKQIRMIRRMQGAFMLRQCDEETYADVIKKEFALLPATKDK
jgi:hypothetical protein